MLIYPSGSNCQFISEMDVRRSIKAEFHKLVRRTFKIGRVTLKCVNYLYHADLVEMLPYSGENREYKHIL